MTDERIELVDREYGQCATVNPSRQIKTRKTSFTSIYDRWRKFRIQQLQKKLDRKIESALTEGYTERNYESKITKNANIIAKLEEKIMVLSKENVPSDYVAKRAIKLRKNMIENLTYNVGTMYTVGLENRDAVMHNDILETPVKPVDENVVPYEEIVPEVVEAEDASLMAAAIPSDTSDGKIDVVSGDLDRQAIVDAVNSSFDDIKDKQEPVPISADEVREVINESFGDKDKQAAPSETVSPVDREAVREIVEEAFQEMEKGKETEAPVVAPEKVVVPKEVTDRIPKAPERVVIPKEITEHISREPKKVVIPAEITDHISMPNTVDSEVDQAVERIRVSRNNVSSVNASQYDENGYRRERRRKYNYTPMTDEEIREAQIKLGFDEHGNLIDNGARPQETVSSAKIVGSFVAPTSIPNVTLEDAFVPAQPQLREMPVVTPEREDTSLGLDLDDGKSMFEIIDQGEKPVDNTPEIAPSEGQLTAEDYNELKKKILFLQQQKQATDQQKLQAEREAEEAARQAQEARRVYEISQANYNERMARLRAFTAALEAACNENVKSAEALEKAAKDSIDYVQEQRELADANNRIIGEIDSMIGESENTEGPKVR